MICSARSGTTSQTIRSITSVDSLSSAVSSGLPGSRPAASASRADIFCSVRSTISDRLVGVPPTIGARAMLVAADSACAGGGGAGERIAGDVPGPLLVGEIGGTAITAVLVGPVVGALPPGGILIVGMPMIVADRGGCDAALVAAGVAGAV